MNYILTPEQIINKANQMIGVTEMINKYDVQPQVQMEYAEMVAEELALDWPEGEGFGSSDGTYVVKDYLDSLINGAHLNSVYQTAWINNRLGVEVK